MARVRANFARPIRNRCFYVVTIIDLDEGPRMMPNIVGADPESIRIGMPVEAVFEVITEDALPIVPPSTIV